MGEVGRIRGNLGWKVGEVFFFCKVLYIRMKLVGGRVFIDCLLGIVDKVIYKIVLIFMRNNRLYIIKLF